MRKIARPKRLSWSDSRLSLCLTTCILDASNYFAIGVQCRFLTDICSDDTVRESAQNRKRARVRSMATCAATLVRVDCSLRRCNAFYLSNQASLECVMRTFSFSLGVLWVRAGRSSCAAGAFPTRNRIAARSLGTVKISYLLLSL